MWQVWQNENAGTDQARCRPTRSCGVFLMADPEGIYNWHRLDGRITTSGQPTRMLISRLIRCTVMPVAAQVASTILPA